MLSFFHPWKYGKTYHLIFSNQVVFENILKIFVRHEYPRALGSPTGNSKQLSNCATVQLGSDQVILQQTGHMETMTGGDGILLQRLGADGQILRLSSVPA